MKKISNRIPVTEIEKRVEIIANSVLEDSFPATDFNSIPRYNLKRKPNIIREVFSSPSNLDKLERKRLKNIEQEIKTRSREVLWLIKLGS